MNSSPKITLVGAGGMSIDDPCSPPDEAACRAMFDELRSLQAARLPF